MKFVNYEKSMIDKRIYIFVLLLLITFTNSAQSVGGITSGTASYCSGNNSGFISLTGYTGNILHWESSIDMLSWANLGNQTSTQSYLNLTQTTYYRAIVQDGSFPPDTSTVSTITIFVPANGGTISGGGTFCVQTGTGTLTLSGTIGNVLYWQYSTDGGNTWTQVSNVTTTLNHPNITQNTIYSAVVQNEPSCPNDTSGFATFTLDSASIAGTVSVNDSIVCTGSNNGTITLNGQYGNITDWVYSEDNVTWNSIGSTSNTQQFSNITTTTSYQAIVENGVCPADSSNIITVTVVNPDPVSAGTDQQVVNHQTVTLNGTGTGTITWSPSDGMDDPTSLTPTVTPDGTTDYIIYQTDANGCLNSDTVTISVYFPIPSGITPNNDGVNDYFEIDNVENLPGNSLVVYNRQGNIVYKASPYENKWNGKSANGKDLPDGIYYYIFDWGDGNEPQNGYVLIKR